MAKALPLDGIRIADLTWMIAGPYGTYLLARMGAEVIKVEGLAPLDHTRENPPQADHIHGPNRSGFFNSLNAGKKSVTLRLRDPEHVKIVKQIVGVSDVVIEAFSYGTIEKFGLGYEELRRVKQDIIMVSCSGFGQDGRDKALRAYMGTIHAYTGLNSLNGYAGGPPKATGGTWADYVSGAALVFAVLAALRHRKRTGSGQFIDLCMTEVVLSLMGDAFMDYFMNGRVRGTQGNATSYAWPNNVYRCKGDDAWVAISIENDDQWDALCRVVGDDELQRSEYQDSTGRAQHTAAIDERLTVWTKDRTSLEVTEALQEAGVPSGPSSSAADLLAQPQFRERGFFVEPDHPEVGKRRIPNMPWRLSTHPDAPCPPAPLLGEHNQYVLGTLLGMPQDVIDKLNAERDEVLQESRS